MDSLVCTKPGMLQYEDIQMPVSEVGRSIIKIKRIGICGTDLHAFEGNQPYFTYPRILGHELSGELVNTDAPGFEPGETVTFIPYFSCGKCVACKNGKPNCCVNINVYGVHIDGGMVQYLSVPSFSLLHGQGLNYEELALAEPLAIGAHGIRRAGVKQSEYVLIMGAGPIGLATMEFAHIAGAIVIAMDVNDSRLEFCKQQLNISDTVNPVKQDVVSELKKITSGDMPTVVIDATGNLKAINNGINYLAHGGRYVLIGLQKEELKFSHPEFHKREATLMSSRNGTREDFDHVINSIKMRIINPKKYNTHTLKFSKVKEEFKNLINPENHVIKAMIEMPDD